MKSDLSHLKYCLPVIQPSVGAVIDQIKAAPHDYQIIEVWLDYVTDITVEGLEKILHSIKEATPLILFRRQNLDHMHLTAERRMELIKALPDTVMLDFDIRHQQHDILQCRQARPDLTLILSSHNYQQTPSDEELGHIIDEMERAGATIYKFSTFCQSEHDALRLMNLLLKLRAAGKRATVLGMGPHGKATRVIGPLWGSEIAYAPYDMANSSAPGQLSLQQLSSILREL